MTPNQIKADKGTATFNKKTGTTVQRDSGKRVIPPSIEVSTLPVPPKIIKTKREKDLWVRLVSAMPEGVFSSLDESLLAAYVHLVIAHENIIDAARDQPSMIKGSQGQDVMNPLIKAQAEMAAKIASIGARLGLDPIARNSINAPQSKKKGAINKDFWGMA